MFRENVSLKEFNTMRTGGNARYFFCVRSIEEVKEAVLFAKENGFPIFILGGGSNVIIPDDEFGGVVIKIEIGGIKFEEISCNEIRVIVGAGVVWDEFVEKVVGMNLYGIENLSSIPGTVGASPVQNIGAYGVEVKDVIKFVEILNIDTMITTKLTNEECLFGYRNSIFKSPIGKKLVILNVVFDLKKIDKLKTEYLDIKKYFSNISICSAEKITLTLSSLRKAIIEIRVNKLPDIKKVGTAGSFFKNPIVTVEKLNYILEKYPDIKYFVITDNSFKLSAAWILDNIGKWKGVCREDVCVYKNHSLVLVNNGVSSSKQILFFAREIINDIEEKTGIILEFEVNII